MEEGKYYDITLKNETILRNFYVAEIAKVWIIGFSENFRMEKILQKNDGIKSFTQGEAFNKSFIVGFEPSQYNEINEEI